MDASLPKARRLRRHPPRLPLPAHDLARQFAAIRILVRDGDDGDEEHTRIGICASGREARSAMESMCAVGIESRVDEESFSWRVPKTARDVAGLHLMLCIGAPRHGLLRTLAASSELVVDLGRLQWTSGGRAFETALEGQVLVARTLAEILLVRGLVCVDYEDVRSVLPWCTHCVVTQGSGPERVEEAIAAVNGADGRPPWTGADAALVVVTFPAGGGKLREVKMAMNSTRDAAGLDADVILATNTAAGPSGGHLLLAVLWT